jgi:phosphomethylpyrimidine synthase
MTTQSVAARDGKITSRMAAVAESEGVTPEFVRDEIAAGRAVLPANPAHGNLLPAIAGRAFRTKVNANIGVSPELSTCAIELTKLQSALDAGADFVMDLSVGASVEGIRRAVLAASPVPVGTVPIYEALARVDGQVDALTADLLVRVISDHASQGIDFMTLHAGLLREHVPLALRRKLGIASRGGGILARWMTKARCQNPLYERWDEIMEICYGNDVTVSLGDGLRPGCLADASDAAQFAELDTLGELVWRCRKRGVQVMVEGPGHVPLDQIEMNMRRQQEVCDHAPFYVLGPLVTDVAAGHDHIACAIGGTVAAFHGASLLCYVTPAEHLGLPTEEDVHVGVIACRIAAQAADSARGLASARRRDDAMADARAALDWNSQFDLALDGKTARRRYQEANPSCADTPDHCSMCGRDFCAVRATRDLRSVG